MSVDYTDPVSVARHHGVPVIVTDYEVARRVFIHYVYDPETCIWHEYRDMFAVFRHLSEFGHARAIVYALGVDGTTYCAMMNVHPLDTGGAIGWSNMLDML